ncbi:hypothetical protein TCAL_15261 [Tigriopus californicus]|uniref:Cytochrome c oxidase assembly protein COX20, mitochondrial n=1 Tax=Tigriopus californicus TaxID=6832 RepID=A0A553NF56_TIGCA|nr:hypothetical protein TCAL_15261 [Tigriopus californicus]
MLYFPTHLFNNSLMIFGRDCAKIPCFRDSLMCGIFTGTVTGIGYNLATSKNPIKLAMTTYLAVTFGVWIFCRRNFLIMEQESRLFRYVEKSRQKLDIPKDFNEENSSTMADSSQHLGEAPHFRFSNEIPTNSSESQAIVHIHMGGQVHHSDKKMLNTMQDNSQMSGALSLDPFIEQDSIDGENEPSNVINRIQVLNIVSGLSSIRTEHELDSEAVTQGNGSEDLGTSRLVELVPNRRDCPSLGDTRQSSGTRIDPHRLQTSHASLARAWQDG